MPLHADKTDKQRVILLVDGEIMRRNVIANTLHGDGYFVLAAAHGYEALELSRTYEGAIDLLIADGNIPRMDSQELCEQIKRDRPQIELLVISSGAAAPQAQPLLCKPFHQIELRNVVRELLSERS